MARPRTRSGERATTFHFTTRRRRRAVLRARPPSPSRTSSREIHRCSPWRRVASRGVVPRERSKRKVPASGSRSLPQQKQIKRRSNAGSEVALLRPIPWTLFSWLKVCFFVRRKVELLAQRDFDSFTVFLMRFPVESLFFLPRIPLTPTWYSLRNSQIFAVLEKQWTLALHFCFLNLYESKRSKFHEQNRIRKVESPCSGWIRETRNGAPYPATEFLTSHLHRGHGDHRQSLITRRNIVMPP